MKMNIKTYREVFLDANFLITPQGFQLIIVSQLFALFWCHGYMVFNQLLQGNRVT